MYKATNKQTNRASNNQKMILNMVADAYRGEGFTMPYYDYQKSIFSRILWTSKRSIMRIVPGNDGSEVFKQNINTTSWAKDEDQTNYLSDTFCMIQTVSNFGDNKYEFITSLRPGSREADLYPESPISFFCNTIHRTVMRVRDGKKTSVIMIPEWRNWTAMNGQLPFPKQTLLFQAITMELNGKACTKSGSDTEEAPLYAVIGLNHKASINALTEALVKPMDFRKPLGPTNSNYGALAEAEGNIIYFLPQVDKDGRRFLSPALSEDASSWEGQQYDLPEDFCMNIWQPWDKILRYLTCEEQLNILAREFGSDTVNYIFSLDHVWDTLPIPDSIRSAGMGRYQKGGTARQSTAAPRPRPQWVPPAPAEEPGEPQEPTWTRQPAKTMQDRLAAIKQATKSPGINPSDLASQLLEDE